MAPAYQHRCIVCGQPAQYGIAICGQFICRFCEHEMVATDPSDRRYPFFVRQMRQITTAFR
ncbi:MAG: sigma factor G inhibitor Gin [Firmicutes bacterium]|nr:sigma factor G inhibitor Gin [Bacillota bacterium]